MRTGVFGEQRRRTNVIKDGELELDCEHPSLGELTAEVEECLCELGDLAVDLAADDCILPSSGP